jgi:dTDP-L-rhamnose 4-epimerase
MASSNRSVLITGGAGFIGCALAERMIEAGDRVTVLDILHPQVHPGRALPERLRPEVRFLPVDVTGGAEWDATLRVVRPDCVVHLAAETGTGQSLTEASRHASVNVLGTARMLDALLGSDAVPEHMVLASSRAVYGEGLWSTDEGVTFSPGPRRHADLARGHWDPPGPPRADGRARPVASRADRTPPHPTSIYGATKLAQEHMLSAWCSATDAALSVLRLQNVYGPGQSLTNAYTGIVTLFARLAAAGEVLDIYEDGDIIRDFVFIDDVADALFAAVNHRPRTRCTVDIGSGRRTTIAELARLVAGRLGAPPPSVSGRFRDGDVRAAFADVSLAAEDLGYRPTWELVEGLDALLAWMDGERSADGH